MLSSYSDATYWLEIMMLAKWMGLLSGRDDRFVKNTKAQFAMKPKT
ncbi:hypothetical protein BURK2_00859 [Burkholderiales bacterium]|nr:hypothetical protein BURK2_00859 [Burkholderiales bacterium]